MKLAIIDDDAEYANTLAEYIRQFNEEKGSLLRSDYYESAEVFFNEDISMYSLVIFDIDMPGLNGMDAARLLRKRNGSIVIIFVTNMPQYALYGYEVAAVDYILKPVSYSDFSLKLRKALRYVNINKDESLTLKVPNGLLRVSVLDIMYVESSLHYLIYHTFDGEHKVRGTMSAAEKELQPKFFARCGSSYLVNLRYVRSIEKEDVLIKNNIKLKISRGWRNDFLNRFTAYLGGIEQ